MEISSEGSKHPGNRSKKLYSNLLAREWLSADVFDGLQPSDWPDAALIPNMNSSQRCCHGSSDDHTRVRLMPQAKGGGSGDDISATFVDVNTLL